MKLILRSYLIILILINCISVNAYTLGNNITVRDGLAHYSVQSIVQDKYGFIWFGTLNGLTRYDGYNLKTYQVSSSNLNTIHNNRIQLIYVDKNRDMWISSQDGSICKYDYQNDNFIRYKNKELSKDIKDSTNRFINKSRQYAYGSGKKFRIIGNKYLFIKDATTGSEINLHDMLPANYDKLDFNCVYIDKSNVLWIGTNYYGVLKIDLMANQFKQVEILGNRVGSKSAIRCILKANTKLWLGTSEDGIVINNLRSEGKRIYSTTQSSGIASNKIRSFHQDNSGSIWVGYNTGADWIDSHTGKLTQVSLRGKITRYEKDAWCKMKTLPNRNFVCIAGDKKNTVWLGTDKGIFKYNKTTNTFRYIDLSDYTNNSIISLILADSKNNLWVGTEGGGIIYLKNDTDKNSPKVYRHIYFEDGNPTSLPDNRVYTMQEDNRGYIWVGTENGVCRINTRNKSMMTFNQTNGLSDPGIACLLLDKHNQLWISHKKGISKIDINSLSIKNYNVQAIDRNSQFSTRSGYYDKVEDCLYFGYSEGYIHFSPREIHDNLVRPIARLVELKIDNQVVGVNQQINGRRILQKALYTASKIRLTYKERSISIEFTGIHFANPELNHFEHMLEGFEKNWIATNADNRVATYSNLKPGNYIFKVRAANANNLWSKEAEQLHIEVLTPWWVTLPAFLVYVILAAGLIYLFISMLLSKQKAQHLLNFEKLKAEQMEEVNRIRTNFFTNISHELRTPLTLILDPINRMITSNDNSQDKFRKEVIKRNAGRLLNLVNELLDVRKAEEGRLTLNMQPTDLCSLIENTRNAFLYNAVNRSISIVFVSTVNRLPINIDPERMETVLYNLLSNAVKNSTDGTDITLNLNVKASHNHSLIEISIQNQGETIDSEELDKVFDPFYQVSSGIRTAISGTGLGLTISRQIVELHGGKITASSANGFTTFSIIIPAVSADKETITQENTFTGNSMKPFEKQDSRTIAAEKGAQSNEELPLLLVIEDNPDIRDYIKSELDTRFKIMEAANGKTGIEIAKTNIPDLIITDVMMPGISGFEVCSEIKNDIRTCHLPVIILTARQSEKSYIEGYETGADSYITKPFSIKLLESRINNLLSNRQKLAYLQKVDDKFKQLQNSKASIESDFLTELKTKILNSDEMYNVEVLASSMNMSRSQLYRKIKDLTNQSASNFIAEVRMDFACQLLSEEKYNIYEIAMKLGYSEQANFSRSFYRRFGKYPTQYLVRKK